MEEFLKPKEVYSQFGISYITLWRWIKAGKIRVIRLPSGRYRIPRSEIEKIKQLLKKNIVKQKTDAKPDIEEAINNLTL